MSEKNYALIVLSLYCALILLSLGDPAMVLTIGRLMLGENLDLFLSLVPYGIISLLLVYLTFMAKETQGRRFFLLIIISVILFFVVRFLNGGREKAHLIEFAILGGLIFWSATRWGFKRAVAYLFVLAVGFITVGFDELLQTSLSLKVFSIRDVLINIMAVALGAITYGGLFWDSSQNEEQAKASS
jgi:VanZ family protein